MKDDRANDKVGSSEKLVVRISLVKIESVTWQKV
jgi:hypothetical protein